MSHWRSVLVVLSVVAGQCVALDAPTSAPSSEPVKGKAGYTPTHMSTSWLFASCFLILLGVIGNSYRNIIDNSMVLRLFRLTIRPGLK